MPPVRVVFQRYHAGQKSVVDATERHRIVRCGRRWGKTTFGEIVTCHEALGPRHVGWFTPTHKLLAEVWRDLRYRLSPLVLRASDQERRIELMTGGVIEAWTLEGNAEAGRSRRYDLVIVDEAGLIPGLRRWWDSCLEATLIDRVGRALILGTPHVVGPDFDRMYDAAEACTDGQWRAFRATTFCNPHLPAVELERIRARRREMPEWLWLQEYEAIPADAVSGFFARSVIAAHRAAHACDPVARGDLVVDADSDTERRMVVERRQVERMRWVPDTAGPWRLWFDPAEHRGRAPQKQAWCFGIDLGAGVGASNSVISAADADTGRKLAEYATPGVTPERMAFAAAAAGIWFGGRQRQALIQFEANGPGEVFAREILRLRYPRLCSGGRVPGDITTTAPSEYGWRSSAQAKETLLAEYRGALASDKFINPSEAALTECLTYTYDRAGRLVSLGGREDEIDEARAPHGDRVVADALAWDAMRMVPMQPAEPVEPPRGGIWDRIMEAERAKRRANRLVY